MSEDVKKAERLWESLSDAEKRALAGEVARRRSTEWRREYPNVISAGVGYRTTRDREEPHQEICLRFLVSKKWKHRRAGSVPERIVTYIERGGRRRRCSIPTDVEELGEGAIQGGMDLGSGVVARSPHVSGNLKGAACCLVRDKQDPDDWYLLGCNHVFTRSLGRTGCAEDIDTSLERRSGQPRPIGPVAAWSPLRRGHLYGMDAALVRVEHPERVSSRFWGTEPRRIPSQMELPGDGEVLAPRGPKPAVFVSEQFGISLPYPCGQGSCRVKIAWVREFRVEGGTKPGDSGSPVIRSDGTLLGMHFYGTVTATALAIPAEALFDSDLFGLDLELVVGHDP